MILVEKFIINSHFLSCMYQQPNYQFSIRQQPNYHLGAVAGAFILGAGLVWVASSLGKGGGHKLETIVQEH